LIGQLFFIVSIIKIIITIQTMIIITFWVIVAATCFTVFMNIQMVLSSNNLRGITNETPSRIEPKQTIRSPFLRGNYPPYYMINNPILSQNNIQMRKNNPNLRSNKKYRPVVVYRTLPGIETMTIGGTLSPAVNCHEKNSRK